MDWVSVWDRLPESNKPLVFWYNNEAHIGYFYPDKGVDGLIWQSFIDGYNCVFNVEFWMPLPSPPEE